MVLEAMFPCAYFEKSFCNIAKLPWEECGWVVDDGSDGKAGWTGCRLIFVCAGRKDLRFL